MEEKEEKKIKNKKINKNIFCSNCGFKLDKETNFCENCGAKVIKHDLESKEKEETNNDEKITDKKENNDTIKTVIYDNLDTKIKEKNTKVAKFNDNKIIIAVISSIITFIVCMLFTVIYCNHISKSGSVETVNKDVTITDTGIAEAVDKVYDSVVVVKTYVKGQLYATGTGFVYKTDDKKGYILTNNHVISNGTEIKVVFTNEKEETVKVVGSDESSDIALLSVDKDAVLSVAEIGDSSKLDVGDTTFAVGAPLDSSIYSWTVTRGILSGKNRLVSVSTGVTNSSSSTYVMEVLQTDTAINSGNSGGPLCNANGEVIGITNMKIASSTVEGMGFAIPIETATSYAEKFISGEEIIRPYIGISMYDLSNNIYSTETGIYIAGVEKNSPADKAGLEKGDIITKIGDKEVSTSSYLKYELYKYEIGDKVKITYTRDGKENTVTVTLGSTASKS